MKVISILGIAAFAFLLIYASLGLPVKDGPKRMESETAFPGDISPEAFYIKNAYPLADTPNMVTVILADFRGIDTLGEETVIFAAGIICLLLLKGIRNHERPQQ